MEYKLTGMITEQANPKTKQIDTASVSEILHIINEEDKLCALAVEKVLPLIEKTVTAVAERFARGGRILYMGAGTSGRIAIMDAAECPPTYGVAPERIRAVIAGGKGSVEKAQEKHEDDREEGADTVRAWGATELDCVIGLATSGRTPYVLSGLRAAREAGAFTAFICANPAPHEIADVVISCITGPEVVTGSTRMKAGTAQKMIVNMISTAVMIRNGRVYQNRMSHISGSNTKLASRVLETLTACCGISKDEAGELLNQAGGRLPAALVMCIAGCDRKLAEETLALAHDSVRDAIALLRR